MIPDRLLQDGQGALADFVLFQGTDLCFVELGFGHMNVLTANMGDQRLERRIGRNTQTSWWMLDEMRDARPTSRSRLCQRQAPILPLEKFGERLLIGP